MGKKIAVLTLATFVALAVSTCAAPTPQVVEKVVDERGHRRSS